MKAILISVLTVLLFSIWAGIALLIVNPYYQEHLPGYTIGRICIWEFVAILIAGLIAYSITKKWGYPAIQKREQDTQLTLNANYGYLLLGYLLLAISVAIWQFWIFSQQF